MCTAFLLFNSFLSAQGLRCCELAFSSPGKWESSSSCFSSQRFLLGSVGSGVCGLRFWCAGLVALQHVGSPWGRIKPVPSALAGRLPTTALPGKPYNILNLVPTGQSDGNADVSFILILSQLHWSFTVLAWDFHFYTFFSVYKFLFAEDSYFSNS